MDEDEGPAPRGLLDEVEALARRRKKKDDNNADRSADEAAGKGSGRATKKDRDAGDADDLDLNDVWS